MDRHRKSLTREEIERLAYELPCSILYNHIMLYRRGDVTWEECVEHAVVELAKALQQSEQLRVDLLRTQPMPGVIMRGDVIGGNLNIGWRDVKVQPPDRREPVVYKRKRVDGRWSVGIAYWTVSEKWFPEINSTEYPDGFTHYMPLPED